MRSRCFGALIVALVTVAGCADAPDPGDLAAFCNQLETGTALTATPTAADLDRLALFAPPAIRPTIEALQVRARDFNELLAEVPPDLEALFNARFDPAARSEQAALDAYAEDSCGIVVDRPASTRWNNYVRENHRNAPWADLVTSQFDVISGRIETASVAFDVPPEPITLVEEACEAVSAFLIAEGADPGRVRVLIGSVVALEYDTPEGVCRLP